jgi:hypothetical protein
VAAGAGNLADFTVSATTLLNDPLNGGLMDKTVSQVTNSDLTNIQASLTAYGLLNVMNGSTTLKALTGTELETSGTTSGQPVNRIATAMLRGVSDSVNVALLNNIINSINTGRNGLTGAPLNLPANVASQAMPEPTIGLVVKVGVKIIDDLAEVGYTTCNNTDGNVSAALNDVGTRFGTISTNTKIMEIGTKLYGFTYKNAIKNNLTGSYAAALTGLRGDANLSAGFDANDSVTTFVFDNAGNIVGHTN